MAADSRSDVPQFNEVKYDIGTFVVSINRLKKQGKPFMYLFIVVSSILSWKYPITSMLVIPTVLLMILLKPEYLIALLLIPLPLLMFINLIRKFGTRKATSINYHQLFVRKDESADLVAKRAAIAKAREHLDVYLDILIEIQDLCNNISSKCEFFYSLYYWTSWKQALFFYLLIIISIVGLFTIKIRFMVAALVFSISFVNNSFKQVLIDVFMFIYNAPSKARSAKLDAFLDTSDEDDEADDLNQQELDLQQFPVVEDVERDSRCSSDSEDLTVKLENKSRPSVHFEVQQEKQREKSGLSFVSKMASSTLASIRKRRAGGNCTSCNVEFSRILKKRNYCRHCGYSYCSKCCHQRVPKVVLGATAPAAYAERVLVCQPCYVFLMSRMKGTNTEIVE